MIGEGGARRLDQVLAALPRVGSRERARRALESGKVTVDGVVVGLRDAGKRLGPDARVDVDWDRPGTSADAVRGRQKVAEAGLVVLYEDADLVAVDKPVGLLTDTATAEQQKERDSVRKRLIPMLRAQGARPFVVHRIDRDTTGVVLLAKTERAAEAMRHQFRNHTPERVYLAVVDGVPSSAQGTWEDPMVWDNAQLIQRRCPPDAEGAFLARAHWRLVEDLGVASVLEVRLDSGRRNQIRLQAQLRGHPLVGERLYRSPDQRPVVAFARQALHAKRLVVEQPSTGQPVVVEAPLAPDLTRLLEQLRAARSARPVPSEPSAKPPAKPPWRDRRR